MIGTLPSECLALATGREFLVRHERRRFRSHTERPGAGSDGLASMRERMGKLGGHCVIRSQPGRGTSVEFRLPLAKHPT